MMKTKRDEGVGGMAQQRPPDDADRVVDEKHVKMAMAAAIEAATSMSHEEPVPRSWPQLAMALLVASDSPSVFYITANERHLWMGRPQQEFALAVAYAGNELLAYIERLVRGAQMAEMIAPADVLYVLPEAHSFPGQPGLAVIRDCLQREADKASKMIGFYFANEQRKDDAKWDAHCAARASKRRSLQPAGKRVGRSASPRRRSLSPRWQVRQPRVEVEHEFRHEVRNEVGDAVDPEPESGKDLEVEMEAGVEVEAEAEVGMEAEMEAKVEMEAEVEAVPPANPLGDMFSRRLNSIEVLAVVQDILCSERVVTDRRKAAFTLAALESGCVDAETVEWVVRGLRTARSKRDLAQRHNGLEFIGPQFGVPMYRSKKGMGHLLRGIAKKHGVGRKFVVCVSSRSGDPATSANEVVTGVITGDPEGIDDGSPDSLSSAGVTPTIDGATAPGVEEWVRTHGNLDDGPRLWAWVF